MRRQQRLVTRRRRTWLLIGLPLAVAAIMASTVLGSGAVFTSTSANPANVFTSGNLHHTNSKAGSAILTASKMKPGDSVQGTVTIANDGDLAGTFSLSTSNLADTPGANGGKMSDVLQLQIVDQTTSTTICNGAIKSVGTVAAGSYAAGASHTYQFTVTFPDGGTPGGATTGDNAYKSSSMSIQFDWNEVQ
jgi:spore coat-associated protein N